MPRLDNKVAVIAGGAGGIGTATSLRVASEGAAVVVGDINAEQAETVAETIRAQGGQAVSCRLDLADKATIHAMFEIAVEHFDAVDLLHCNAADTGGLDKDLDALEISEETWERTLQVNLTGHFHCTRAAIPLMLKRGGGSIVYTSSGAAFFSDVTRVAYAVSKAGLHAFLRHVARRWGKEGIRANAVAPGLVMTPASAGVPEKELAAILERSSSTRLGKPDDIAAMVAMLFSEDGAWINGQAIGVDGGYYMR